jgi:hypothetical protein
LQRFKQNKKPLIDWQARRASIEALRTCYRLGDDIQDTVDDQEAEAARQRQIDRCLNDVESYATGHPVRIAAEKRLAFLNSRRYDAQRSVKLELRKFGRRTQHELLIGLAPAIDMLFIVVFNVAAVILLFWLLSLL